MGLSLQKGLPVALIPVFVFVFGDTNYAQYVLFFSVVQVYAVATSFGIPQSVVPFWFRQERPDEFFGAVVLLVLALGVALSPVGLIILNNFVAARIDEGHRNVMAAAIILFALLYNFSALATAAARARNQQGPFFWAILAGAASLTLLTVGAYLVGITTLYGLIVAQATTHVVSILIISKRDILKLSTLDASTCASHALKIFKASIPVYAYTLTTMYIFSVDKWVVKTTFSNIAFVEYIIAYQFAFSILFVPTAIVFYLGPRISQLASLGEHREVRRLEAKARNMTISLSLLISILIYIYGMMTGIKLTSFYWILVAGFLVHGLYMIISNRLMAYLNFKSMLAISIISGLVFTACLAIAIYTNQMLFVYASWTIYSGIALGLSVLVARTAARRNGHPPRD